jgi:hypothetical protein
MAEAAYPAVSENPVLELIRETPINQQQGRRLRHRACTPDPIFAAL